MDRLNYRVHTALVEQSRAAKIERRRSELAQGALQALRRAKRARGWTTLRDGAISALERLLMALAVVGAVYGGLVFASDAVCLYRGVC